jgi:hypothetical protein
VLLAVNPELFAHLNVLSMYPLRAMELETPSETFKIVNVNFRDDKGLLKYGDQVALYNYAAGGKYLAVYARDGPSVIQEK